MGMRARGASTEEGGGRRRDTERRARAGCGIPKKHFGSAGLIRLYCHCNVCNWYIWFTRVVCVWVDALHAHMRLRLHEGASQKLKIVERLSF